MTPARDTYPENCLRGITGEHGILDEVPAPRVSTDVFQFETRDDGGFSQSINWQDDDNAIPFTLAQTRRDRVTPQFVGLAVVATAELDRLSKLAAVGGVLSYDREPTDENPYHGNLLLAVGVPKPQKAQIAAALALLVTQIIRP